MHTKTEPLTQYKDTASNKHRHIYTVGELTQDIKLILENSFDYIWVEGEVSNFQPAVSGHFYFTLKDGSAVLSVVMFSRANKNLKFKIENGIKVICFGKLSAYGPRGQYQVIVEIVEPKGVGSLQLALEQLKKKLEKEGLFSPVHKKPMPYLPSRIGIVTSAQGAAIKDILKVIDRRFREVEIIINAVRVQGEGAREDIVEAIKDFNRFGKVEVIILARGGGSIEDLWVFNEEQVAYAIYNSRIPIISAIGHERDVTIADLVADLRAPTPSVAAELVLPKKEDLEQNVEDYVARLHFNIKHIMELSLRQLESISRKLRFLSPATIIIYHQQRIDDLSKQIQMHTINLLKIRLAHFQKILEKLEALSPLNILSRGYSITFKMPGEQVIRDVKSLTKGSLIKTRVQQGEIISTVQNISNGEKS